MSALRKHHFFSEAEYWEYEEVSPLKHEYFRGELFAMAGASGKHNDIVDNAHASLHRQLRGKPCRPRVADQRIKVERNSLQTYPDVVVVCPPFVRDPNNTITLLDATVIIEVLSPSTAQYDKTTKFDLLRELPSLRHYLTVEQDKIEVVHRFWSESSWQEATHTAPDDVVFLRAIECELRVGDLYEDVEI